MSATRSRGGLRSFAVALASVSISIAIIESVFAVMKSMTQESYVSGSYKQAGYFIHDADLGFAIQPGIRVSAVKTFAKDTLYQASYTIDSTGHRLTTGNPLGPTWVFLVCSYTFGEGVNDDETLPQDLSRQLGLTQNVVNLAVHGYGPHQMLRMLETNRLPNIHPPVRAVIYQAIWSHVRRTSGRAEWDLQGPKYELEGNRDVRYVGPFRTRVGVKFAQALQMSDAATYFLRRSYFNARFTDHDLELYTAIVKKSAKLVNEKLGTDLTVLYWDEENELAARVKRALASSGLRVILVSDIIPRAEWDRVLVPHDHHPNREANQRIAAYLAHYFEGPQVPRTQTESRLYLSGAR